MPRFYIPPSDWNPDALALHGAEAHHCLDVLRMQPGQRATVFNGRGIEATVEITPHAKRDRVDLKLLQQTRSTPLGCQLTLAQAIPKGKNMDFIVEKATELGAAAIAPLISERTVMQIDPDDAARKQEKWQRVVIEASKQCGQNWLPAVLLPERPKQFFDKELSFDLMLIASLQPDAVHLKDVFRDWSMKKPRSVLVVVGPEGDFTPAELALAKSRGCRPISLGPIILRAETAALYCLSVLSHELFSPSD